MVSGSAFAGTKVYDEASLQAAFADANVDSSIEEIVFAKNAYIKLTAPVVYTGTQDLTLVGRDAVIDGSDAGSFVLDDDLTAVTEDGTLVFNTAANLSFKKLTISNSATRGIVVNIPTDATGDDISVSMNNVHVLNSALYGVHIDDNADEFDDGVTGSAIGIDLRINNSTFIGNGTGAIDFDGVRVDEHAEGDIEAFITNTHIDMNGGDGIELDEAGDGDVDATMRNVSVSYIGFFNEEDLDDGFDIDEANDGNVSVKLVRVTVNSNMDEGLDFDEEGEGNLNMALRRVEAMGNTDEGIKADEVDAGDIEANMKKINVAHNGDDGVQFTELGEGAIEAKLNHINAIANKKYGIKMEQWVEEDEDAGSLKVKNTYLSENGKGDEIKVNNIIIE